MAQSSTKKTLASNQKSLGWLALVFFGSLCLHIALSFGYFHSYVFASWRFFMLCLISIINGGFLYLLKLWSLPVSGSSSQKLVAPEVDLSDSGNYIIQFMIDFTYISSFVLVASLFSAYAWWSLLIIPLYFFGVVIKWMFFKA